MLHNANFTFGLISVFFFFERPWLSERTKMEKIKPLMSLPRDPVVSSDRKRVFKSLLGLSV